MDGYSLSDRPQAKFRAVVLATLGLLALGAFALVSVLGQIDPVQPGGDRAFTAELPLVSQMTKVVNATTPSALLPVAPGDAKAINAAMPIAKGDNPPATSIAPYGSGTAYGQALECMTAAIYYEAASESDDGERAVAQVVLNRMRHPAFPHSICGVVFQGSERATGCQFSFTCDGSLARIPSHSGWARARRIALSVLAGSVYAPVGWATHYHANYVVPRWAGELRKVAVVGTHIFYRWPSGLGLPKAFSVSYSGVESTAPWIMAAALARSSAASPIPTVVLDTGDLALRAPIHVGETSTLPVRNAPPRWAIHPGTTNGQLTEVTLPHLTTSRPNVRPLMSINDGKVK